MNLEKNRVRVLTEEEPQGFEWIGCEGGGRGGKTSSVQIWLI